MCGVDLVLKLCNLVVEVGRGKCLVEGCLPGCLVAIRSAGRAPDGQSLCLQSRAAGACCGDKSKPGFLACARCNWSVFGVATLRNGVKRRDLAIFYFIVFR